MIKITLFNIISRYYNIICYTIYYIKLILTSKNFIHYGLIFLYFLYNITNIHFLLIMNRIHVENQVNTNMDKIFHYVFKILV